MYGSVEDKIRKNVEVVNDWGAYNFEQRVRSYVARDKNIRFVQKRKELRDSVEREHKLGKHELH